MSPQLQTQCLTLSLSRQDTQGMCMALYVVCAVAAMRCSHVCSPTRTSLAQMTVTTSSRTGLKPPPPLELHYKVLDSGVKACRVGDAAA